MLSPEQMKKHQTKKDRGSYEIEKTETENGPKAKIVRNDDFNQFDINKIKFENKQTKKDKGGYDVVAAGTETEPKAKIVRNPEEDELDTSKIGKSSIIDLVMQWRKDLKLDKEVLTQDEIALALYNPDQYILILNEFQKKYKPDNYNSYLDQVELSIQQTLPILEEKKEEAVNIRGDYKETEDEKLDKEIKLRSERLIELLDTYIANGQKMIDFIKGKKTELLT